MEHLVRSCYKQGGYVFARKAEAISGEYGVARVARLASNENPELPSGLAIAAAERALQESNRYPDEQVDVLQRALTELYGGGHFLIGAGMDGIIETLIRTLVEPGETVAIATPTFSYYGLAATAQGANIASVPRDPTDFSIDAERLVIAGKTAKVTIICSPNNPTGNATAIADIGKVLDGVGGLVFLDNAYVEFSDFDYLPLMKKHENLVIGRTFSKVYSLAGMRIGYAFAPSWLVPYYQRAGTPFAVNTVSAAAAAAALKDPDHPRRYIDQVKRWRARFAGEVKYPVLPSDANFMMVDVSPHSGDWVVENLAQRGILVRSCRSFDGLPDHYIRVSVGQDWENELFIREINSI